MTNHDLLRRVERLERENERMRDELRCRSKQRPWLAGIALGLVTGCLVTGSSAPIDLTNQVVKARGFRVVDAGKTCAELVSSTPGEAELRFFDGAERERLRLGYADRSTWGLWCYDTNGREQLASECVQTGDFGPMSTFRIGAYPEPQMILTGGEQIPTRLCLVDSRPAGSGGRASRPTRSAATTSRAFSRATGTTATLRRRKCRGSVGS